MAVKKSAEMYAGCVSGAQQMDEYLDTIKKADFTNTTIQKEREIIIPDEIMLQYVSPDELADFKKQGIGIFSITVYADKPAADKKSGSCCGPDCCSN